MQVDQWARSWLLLCLTSCTDDGGQQVKSYRPGPDRGATADAAGEPAEDSAVTGQRSESALGPSSDASAHPTVQQETTIAQSGTAIDAGPTESPGQPRADANVIPASASDIDAAMPVADAGEARFELPDEEDCSGVQFVEPESACRDLAGLFLANPVLVTDSDGEWNPGEVATLEVDLVAQPRADESSYVSPAIVALIDIESSEFATVRWKNFEWFGINAGKEAPHRIELRLAPEAPRGARVWLHLEPATSGGNTTVCDCPEVNTRSGMTLMFDVR